MSDPVKFFEDKLNNMCLAELKVYKQKLDATIQQMIMNNEHNDKIEPLILYRGILEHTMKTKMNQR